MSTDKSVIDFVGKNTRVPIEIMKKMTPMEVVFFHVNGLSPERSRDFGFAICDTMTFMGSAAEYPNLQLFCLLYVIEMSPIFVCVDDNRNNIFENPCPEIAEIWQIIIDRGLRGIPLCRALTRLGIPDPELSDNIAVFNASFAKRTKSARKL